MRETIFCIADPIVALKDIPKENVKKGDVGFVVHIFNDGEAFTVEFADESGAITGLATEDAEWWGRYIP